jgi:hypothetical protein
MHLGNINPETKMFEHYGPDMKYPTFYKRGSNHVINEIYVLPAQLDKLKTLNEVLGIDGISVKRELFPE